MFESCRRLDGVRVLALVLVVVGCATATARVQPRRMTDLVISRTQRIFVAGFVTDAGSPLDVNGETVRLLRDELRRQGALGVIRADPVTLTSEAAFQDIAYWRTIGEEHGAPLIVSGVVTLRRAAPNVIQRGGRAGAYDVQPGFFLETDLVLIDGATGRVMSSQHLPRQSQHGSGRRASPAVMYFAMMDRLMPDLVRAVFAPHSTTSR